MPETPIETAATVTNDRSEAFDITEVGYTVKMNDVVLADESKDKSVTVSGQSSKTVEDTIVLDNTKLGDWWKTHVENDERSTLSVSYYVVVEYRGQTQRIELDSLNYEKTVATDVLGRDSN